MQKQNINDPAINTDTAWEKLNKRIEEAEKDNSRKLRTEGFPVFYRVAAILVVIMAAVISIYITIFHKNDVIVYATDKNEVSRYILPDGSLVELNELSELKYLTGFKGDIRAVTLKGEAYFDVEPNPEKPFVIETRKTKIKVLGTSFNVLSRDKHQEEVFVETGKVKVSLKENENQNIQLIPGQLGYVKKNQIGYTENKDINYLAWKTKVIVFKETSLPEVVETIGHAFNCPINIEDDKLYTLKYTATITNQPLHKVLDALDSSFEELKIQVKGKEIIISGTD